jgi:hypothetical protein
MFLGLERPTVFPGLPKVVAGTCPDSNVRRIISSFNAAGVSNADVTIDPEDEFDGIDNIFIVSAICCFSNPRYDAFSAILPWLGLAALNLSHRWHVGAAKAESEFFVPGVSERVQQMSGSNFMRSSAPQVFSGVADVPGWVLRRLTVLGRHHR